MIEVGALSDEELEARFLVTDKVWEANRRVGGWNLRLRNERNALADELLRRKQGS